MAEHFTQQGRDVDGGADSSGRIAKSRGFAMALVAEVEVVDVGEGE